MSLVSTTSNTVNQRTQPSGVPAPDTRRGGSAHATGSDGYLLELHARLCELVPDQAARAAMLKVPASVDAAWLAGRMLPVLRAQRKPLETVLSRLERDAAHSS